MSTTRRRKEPNRAAALLAAAVAVLALAGAAGWELRGAGLSTGVGGPFALLDANGAPVTERSFHGRFALIYFGYASCPDICPTTLATMSAALDLLGPGGARVQPVFITVDPGRDTPAALRAYVARVDPRLLALTGPEDAVDDVLRSFHVQRSFLRQPDGDGYLVDHSAVLYLLGPDGRFVAPVRADLAARQMASAIAAHLPSQPGAVP